MHLRNGTDSVVPTGLDLGATSIPGLKPGAILFRPCGTQFARGVTGCTRSAQNGDMFQAPPRRDYVSPFQPEGSHGGLPLHEGSDGQP